MRNFAVARYWLANIFQILGKKESNHIQESPSIQEYVENWVKLSFSS